MSHQRVEEVVIVGGGTAGWIAAATIAQTYGDLVNIRLIESDSIGTVGVGEATIPQIRRLNGYLGIDEDEFLRRTNGTFKLGIEFVDWGGKGERYIHTFGDAGINLTQTHFHQYWLRARAMGHKESLWHYSLHNEAAYAHKFARMERVGNTPMGGLHYAFHFDALLYAAFLRQLAEAKGVRRIEGKVVDVTLRPDDGFIESLVLDDGATVSGELFIDCSGFRSLLLGQKLGVPYQDWSKWLAVDRAWAVPCDSAPDLLPYTRSTAHDAGWQWRIPLQNRIGNGHVFSSAYLGEEAAVDVLMQNLDGPAKAEPRLLRFTTGRRDRFWHKNCVALGLASGFMEPLESTSIHLVQSNVDRLLNYFPTKNFGEADIAEYNRQTIREFELIRDFLILHYKVTRRDDTEFWRYTANMSVPDSLMARIDLFAENGRLSDEPSDLFRDTSWLQVMLGQGLFPRGYSPDADRLGDAQLEEFLKNVRMIVEKAVGTMPDHHDFIAQNCAMSGPAMT